MRFLKKSFLMASLVAGSFVWAFPVTADDLQKNAKNCNSKTPEVSVRGCTAFLNMKGLDKKYKIAAYNVRGVAYANLKQYEQAIADYTQAIRLKPDYALAYNNRGLAYANLKQYEQALADHTQAIRLKPDDAVAYNNRGKTYYRLKQYDKALADFTQAIRLKPDYDWAYTYRGIAYANLKQYEQAIADYTQAIRLKPDFAEAYTARGDAYYRLKQYDKALADFTQAIRLKPDDAVAYNARAYNVYFPLGQYTQALADLNEALRLKPDYDWAYTYRGTTYAKLKQYEQAIADYTQAIRLKPDFAEAYTARGDAYYRLKQYDKALADYTQAIRLKPDDAVAYNARAYNVYFPLGQYTQALADLNEALRLKPDFAHAYGTRGLAHTKLGNQGQAIADHNYAIKLRPDLAELYYERATTYQSMNQTAQALADYRKYLELAHPQDNTEFLENARKQIAALESGGQSGSQAVQVNLGAQQNLSSQPTGSISKPSAALNERRIALVIGNGSYSDVTRLANPGNDAKAVANAFRRLGFTEVVEAYDQNYSDFKKTLKIFGDKAATADWAVVYYAGHGIQASGENYLIPTDAKLQRASDIEDETIPLKSVLSRVGEAKKMRMVILDACRDNPFVRKMAMTGTNQRSINRGLALVEPEASTLVVFAARDGQVAEDGTAGSTNSPFAQALLQHIEEPGLDISLLFRKVRDSVLERTGRKQEPFTYGSLPGVTLSFK